MIIRCWENQRASIKSTVEQIDKKINRWDLLNQQLANKIRNIVSLEINGVEQIKEQENYLRILLLFARVIN